MYRYDYIFFTRTPTFTFQIDFRYMQDRSKQRKKIERKMTDYMYLTMGDRERNKIINMKPWFSNDNKVASYP